MDEQKFKQQAEQIAQTILSFVQDGNASRVMLKRKGELLFNLPLTAGVAGALIGLSAAPCAMLTAALVSFGLDCEIEIEKKDGAVVNLSETEFGAKLEAVKASTKDMFRRASKTDPTDDIPFAE